ncbi:MAG: DUF4270 family protein [Bacteroidota bacterium]
MRTIPGALKIFPAFFIFLSVLLFAAGCQKSAIQYGQQYIDNGITNIILVDSISPTVSTILKDSVITSQSGTLLLGSYSDPYFGKTASNSYVQLSPPVLTDLLNNAQFDSLVLLMKCNGAYYGDTTLPITLSVTQLSQEIKFFEGQTGFSNYATFPLNPTPLGTKSFVLRPLTGDSANIKLDNSKGMELYNMIKLKDNILKDNAVFTDYFKGLNISATGNNNIFGMKDSVVMRLYYHQTDVGPQNKYFDFTFYNKALQFNNITADRTGTPLTALSTQNTVTSELFSTSSNNIGYLQPSTGLYLKIGFPTIRKLLERSDFIKIIRADLIVKPLVNSYGGIYPLPPVLNANQTDGSNEPGSPISSSSGGSASTETGNLLLDGVYGINTSYTYDVTGYLQQEIANSSVNKDGLLLLPPGGLRFSSMNRLVIGDAQNGKNKLQLNVYYISVNK